MERETLSCLLRDFGTGPQPLLTMEKAMYEIVVILRDIRDRLDQMRESDTYTQKTSLKNRRKWTKQEVLDELKMSEPTYNRNLKKGLLVPMRLNGADMYFEEDILVALEESRRKGRV